MSKADQFTRLRNALNHSWAAADRVTYDLLFNIVVRSHCQAEPIDNAWRQLRQEFWQRVQSPDYEQEFRSNSELRTLFHRHHLLPGGSGLDQDRIMISLIRISQHLNDLWDHIPDAFKCWHERNSAIDAEQLRKIDRLWLKRSNGKFGFSVQREIFLECGGEIIMGEDPRLYTKPLDLRRFQGKVGWVRIPFSGFPPFYSYQEAPRGHLPILSWHNPVLIQSQDPFEIPPENYGYWQTPICQYYPWWILSHSAFAT
ncbi:gun4 domain protein [Leptolyngbya sp. Heron Island J]|uniref:GUN4 domain-containing protein n=1 Tax=Leptolyngbya sp. Heron Island J TaxID=1385935 RepID=UPI0003B9D6CF|nr:GUN4 domain-containing protein [Leptolyngbya sp. Heron Island J]ESA35318.1 gun4 domain protein [Leptolyngbya sp. Heron Island J]